MNDKINEMAKAYDEADRKLIEAERRTHREKGRLLGDVEGYLKAVDEYDAALKNLRNAVGIRAMCAFVTDDNAKSAVKFFKDFPAK